MQTQRRRMRVSRLLRHHWTLRREPLRNVNLQNETDDGGDECNLLVEPCVLRALGVIRVQSRNTECAICLESMGTHDECVQTTCKHCFHDPCLRQWFSRNSTCPVCRFEHDTGARAD